MAKALLIACRRAEPSYGVYPLGPTLVAEAARARGHTVELWDCQSEAWGGRAQLGPCRAALDASPAAPDPSQASLAGVLERLAPQIVGISLRDLDAGDGAAGAGAFVRECVALVAEVRRYGEYPVVLGGAGYSLFPDELLRAIGADYGVVGEGEEVFADLLDSLGQGYAPQRRIWRQQAPTPPERMGAPSRDPALARACLAAGGLLNVLTKRGCDRLCAHCSYPGTEGADVRSRPAGEVAEEFAEMRQRYGARHLVVADAEFNDREGRFLEVAETLAQREVGVEWTAILRPARFAREEVALLWRAGLRGAEWSTHATTDATLEALNKGFTWSEVEQSNRLFAEAGVANCHYAAFGGPGETPATLREGLRRIGTLRRSVVQMTAGVRILPHTALHARALAEGVVRQGDSLLTPCIYRSPEVDPRAVRAALRQAQRGATGGSVVATRLGIAGAPAAGESGPAWMDRVGPV